MIHNMINLNWLMYTLNLSEISFKHFLIMVIWTRMIIFGYVTKIQLPGIIFVLEQHNICQSLSMVQYLLLSRLMAVIFLSVREAVCFVSG